MRLRCLLLLAFLAYPMTARVEGAPQPQPGNYRVPSTEPTLSTAKENVYDLLDQEKTEELQALKPRALLKALRKGRPWAKSKPQSTRLELTDGNKRKTQYRLMVPPKPTGLVILLHGLGGDCEQLVPHFVPWARGKGLIVAAPTAQKLGDEKNEDWTRESSRLAHWWSYRPDAFALTLLSELKRKYPIDENRVYLSGYSMGGFGTWNLGLRFADRFAAIVPIAGGVSQKEYVLGSDEAIRKLLVNAFNLPIYILHGANDRTVPVRFDQASRDQLQKLNYPHEYNEQAGAGHIMNIQNGSKLMKGIQAWAQSKKRNPHPKVVRLHSLANYMQQSYWVRIDERADKGAADVTAAVVKGNKIRVECVGVKKLTLFLDPKVIKIKKSITVLVNGTERFKGKVKESSAVILESWRAREDRELLYSAKIEIDLSQ